VPPYSTQAGTIARATSSAKLAAEAAERLLAERAYSRDVAAAANAADAAAADANAAPCPSLVETTPTLPSERATPLPLERATVAVRWRSRRASASSVSPRSSQRSSRVSPADGDGDDRGDGNMISALGARRNCSRLAATSGSAARAAETAAGVSPAGAQRNGGKSPLAKRSAPGSPSSRLNALLLSASTRFDQNSSPSSSPNRLSVGRNSTRRRSLDRNSDDGADGIDPASSFMPLPEGVNLLSELELRLSATLIPVLRCFVPTMVERAAAGGQCDLWVSEHRKLVTIFLKVLHLGPTPCEVAELDTVHRAVSAVQEAAIKHCGTVTRLICDDKGVRFLIAFGLPGQSSEDDERRAVLCSLAPRRLVAARCVRRSIRHRHTAAIFRRLEEDSYLHADSHRELPQRLCKLPLWHGGM
jgi:hypothetical protein